MQTGIPQSQPSCFLCNFFTALWHCQVAKGQVPLRNTLGRFPKGLLFLNNHFISNFQDWFPRINRACLFQGCRLMQNCIWCHIICYKCKRNETISSATPIVAGFHHSWVGNDDVQIGDKQIQDIHAICCFQVHALQRGIRNTACLQWPSLPHKECWNPVSGSKQPSFTNIQRTSRPINGNITPTSSFHSWSVLAKYI